MAKVALFRGFLFIKCGQESSYDAFNVVVAAFAEIFWVSFPFTYLEGGLQWLGRTFDLDFVVSEKELLLGHVLFAPVGLNKDCLGHGVSSDELVLGRAWGPTNLLF